MDGMLALLYRPSVKDVMSGSSNVRRYIRSFTTSQVAASIGIVDTDVCPTDTCRLLTNCIVSWLPGAAQTPIQAVLACLDANANVIQAIWGGMPDLVVAAANHRKQSLIEALLFQGDVLTLTADFNAGANANAVFVTVTGWEFPRGTLQR